MPLIKYKPGKVGPRTYIIIDYIMLTGCHLYVRAVLGKK